MATNEDLARWAATLLSQGRRAISLDEVGDAIGAAAVTPPEIEKLFDRLEAAGCTIGETSAKSSKAHLKEVLATARAFRTEHGRTPTTREIAEASGLETSQVNAALLFVQVLQR